jgi:hypothetical protein
MKCRLREYIVSRLRALPQRQDERQEGKQEGKGRERE